ncbi:hypothetical protein OJF2_08410 [Aquisphaera giovannonii]|uniref:DUF4398 domain-containing protein n=1 Tax=Aquisphaera giovannonii TaxID=406548 RepID=A0A5B9VWX2_9BACT|nr:hypothetical protein [Aquisphaera giovannonii]QEH32371.1 hypothetical protein OJF2_08410 [Aquisphaera giovannonii]
MMKLIAMGLSSLLGIGIAGFLGGPQPPDGPPTPPEKAKGKKGAPGDELRKTYDILRRVRSGSDGGRTEERIKDWTDRATELYRKALRAREDGERRRARELAVASHDLARVVDHARNAARLDRTDPDLPPPPEDDGPEDLSERTLRDLHHAYRRIKDADSYGSVPDSALYLRGARDLYNAARRDVEAGRTERGGELARAAEAMTHVPEHLANAGDPDGPPAKDEPPKKKFEEAKEKRGPRGLFDPPPPKEAERPGPRGRELPPPLD